MFQTTRRRLAIWYTTVTAVLLLLFATGIYFYFRNTLIERVDDTLNHVVEVVERSLAIQSLPAGQFRVNIEASFRDNAEAVEDDRIDLEWFNPTGKLLWSTFAEPLKIPIHSDNTGETVQVSSERWLRQVTERVQIGRQVLGYLRVSHPWFEVTKPSRQLMLDLMLGIGFMIASVAGIGWLLSGIAIQPVRESYQRLKQFTADASHELRNPIATIQTNVQVALAEPDIDPEIQRQQLKVIERLTQRLGRLVNDLLFLARQDSGILQADWVLVPLDALLMEVIEEQQLMAKEKCITLSLHLGMEVAAPPKFLIVDESSATEMEEDLFTMRGDWDQLARLFTNLTSNALQYTLAGGIVKVELERIRKSSYSQLQVKIVDTGIGIPESALNQIFDRFYRGDPARTYKDKGSGLGLAIAQAIVESHQGKIQVNSVLNEGTMVIVTLPCAVEGKT
jgi:OmpR-family two-component system manganese-sensing sensor histidine kinase